MKFVFTITEYLERQIVIETDSEAEAYKKGFEKYRNEEIVLDYKDYTETTFDIKQEEEE